MELVWSSIFSVDAPVKPKDGVPGENETKLPSNLENMRENMHRKQNQADLQYVKLSNKNRDKDEVVVERANEYSFIDTYADEIKEDKGGLSAVNRHISNVYDEYDFNALVRHQIVNPIAVTESKYAISDNEDMQADKLNYETWEDQIHGYDVVAIMLKL